jgi:PAS domain S-box-containing protein
MLKFNLNGKILVGFSLALGILVWLAVYSYNGTVKLISSSQWVAHTQDVLYHAEQVLAVASNIELGQRGYTLTGNAKFLEPYNQAKSAIRNHYDSVWSLTSDNPVQHERLKELDSAIDELLLFSSSAIEARTVSFQEAQQINATVRGKLAMDRIRLMISMFQMEEKNLLRIRTRQNEADIANFNLSFISLLVVTAIIILFVFYTISMNLKIRTESEKQLKIASENIKDLYENAPCGYHSIDSHGVFVDINRTLLTWLGYRDRQDVIGKLKFNDVIAASDLKNFDEHYPLFKKQGFIKDLEFNLKRKDGSSFPVILSSTAIYDEDGNFVKSRSNTFDNSARKEAEIRIKELNKELEAFTYSVSHDLRAPLRSIDGYARVLQEDYTEKLDQEGKRVINVIMNNAQRMGKLIDDLLDFARLGRKEAARSNTDMTPLVQNIAGELAQQERGRKIDIVVKPLHPAKVDNEMIRQVWINLISNAIKYTGKKEEAKIEISSFDKGDEVCFQIRDNGVGFDMQYSDKLFGVFQRLHKMQEFSGTGVGLAIVKRIISQHKGQVWAEGTLNQGAAFYFSIPSNGKQ